MGNCTTRTEREWKKKQSSDQETFFVDAVSFSTGFIRGSTFSLTLKSMDKKGTVQAEPFRDV